jgi:hypothetical protein
MKNIHLLSKSIFDQLGVDHYGKTTTQIKIAEFLINKNIYITNDEELVLGGYHFNSKYGDEPQKTNQRDIDSKKYWEEEDYYITKIILTTDQELIADGVQPIDDEFLEWFVKNPSCEFVKITTYGDYLSLHHSDSFHSVYKIIISQEEPKQETLEEFSKRISNDESNKNISLDYQDGIFYGINVGAKWQAERMYSEEDLKQAFSAGRTVKNYKAEWEETYSDDMTSCKYENFKEWFQQFKKK